jgi:hypothetical protein
MTDTNAILNSLIDSDNSTESTKREKGRPKKYHSDEQKKQAHKEAQKRYYVNHRAEILEKHYQYYDSHRDQSKESFHNYYVKKRDEVQSSLRLQYEKEQEQKDRTVN